MKVLMVIERYVPAWGGAENQLEQLIPHLNNSGCEIAVVTHRFYKKSKPFEYIEDIPVDRLGFSGTGFISRSSYAVALFWYILHNRNSIDIIHVHGGILLGALGVLLGRIVNKIILVKITTAGCINRFRRNFFKHSVLSLFKRADFIICTSNEILRELKSINEPREKIVCISNAVDTQRFKPIAEDKCKIWRVKKGFGPEASVIVYSGRFVKRKGLDFLLEIWPEVLECCTDAHLIVLGSGCGHPDSIEQQVRKKVVAKKIKNVSFEGETNSPEYYLNRADIFVFPSKREGCPNSLLEAMASTLGVVAFNIGGVEDLISYGRMGILTSVGDAEGFVNGIIDFVKNPYKRNVFGHRAREHVLNNHSFKKIAQKYINIYRCNLDK